MLPIPFQHDGHGPQDQAPSTNYALYKIPTQYPHFQDQDVSMNIHDDHIKQNQQLDRRSPDAETSLDSSSFNTSSTSQSTSQSNYFADESSNNNKAGLNSNGDYFYNQEHLHRQIQAYQPNLNNHELFGNSGSYQALNGNGMVTSNQIHANNSQQRSKNNVAARNETFNPSFESPSQTSGQRGDHQGQLERRSVNGGRSESYSDLNSGGGSGYQQSGTDWRIQRDHLLRALSTSETSTSSSNDYPLECQSESQLQAQPRITAKDSKAKKAPPKANLTSQPKKKKVGKKKEDNQPQDYFQQDHLTLEKELGKGEDYGALGELSVGFYSTASIEPITSNTKSNVEERRPSVYRSGTSIPQFSLRQPVEERRSSTSPSNSTQIPALSLNGSSRFDSSSNGNSWSNNYPAPTSQRDLIESTRHQNGLDSRSEFLRPNLDLEQYDPSSNAMARRNSFHGFESVEPQHFRHDEDMRSPSPSRRPRRNAGEVWEMQLEMMNSYKRQEAADPGVGLENFGSYVPYAPAMARAYSWESRSMVETQAAELNDKNKGESMPPVTSNTPLGDTDQEAQASKKSGLEQQADPLSSSAAAITSTSTSTSDPLSTSASRSNWTPFDDLSDVSLMPMHDETLRFTSTFSSISQPNVRIGSSSYYQKKVHSLPAPSPGGKEAEDAETAVPKTKRGSRAKASRLKSKGSTADTAMFDSLEANPSTSVSDPASKLSRSDSGSTSISPSPPSIEEDTSMASPDGSRDDTSISHLSLPLPVSSTPLKRRSATSSKPTLQASSGSGSVKMLKSNSFPSASTTSTSTSAQSARVKPGSLLKELSRKRRRTSVKVSSLIKDDNDSGLTSGKWHPSEDEELLRLIDEFGVEGMIEVASKMTTGRSLKQCRTRWIEVLDPEINKDPFSDLEDRKIIELYLKFSARWGDISAEFDGRPPQRLKDRWRGSVRRNLPALRQIRDKLEKSMDRAIEMNLSEWEWKDERIDWEVEDWDCEMEQEFAQKSRSSSKNETKAMKNERKRLEDLEIEQLTKQLVWRGRDDQRLPSQSSNRFTSLSENAAQTQPPNRGSSPSRLNLQAQNHSSSLEYNSSLMNRRSSASVLATQHHHSPNPISSFASAHEGPPRNLLRSHSDSTFSSPFDHSKASTQSLGNYSTSQGPHQSSHQVSSWSSKRPDPHELSRWSSSTSTNQRVFPEFRVQNRTAALNRPKQVSRKYKYSNLLTLTDKERMILSSFKSPSVGAGSPRSQSVDALDSNGLSKAPLENGTWSRSTLGLNYTSPFFGASVFDDNQQEQLRNEQAQINSNSPAVPSLYQSLDDGFFSQNVDDWVASSWSYQSHQPQDDQTQEGQSQMRAAELMEVFNSSSIATYSPMQRCDFFSQPGEGVTPDLNNATSFSSVSNFSLSQVRKRSETNENKRKRGDSMDIENMGEKEDVGLEKLAVQTIDQSRRRRRRIGTEGVQALDLNSRIIPSLTHQISSSRTDLDARVAPRSRTFTYHAGASSSKNRQETMDEGEEAAESLALFASRPGKVNSD